MPYFGIRAVLGSGPDRIVSDVKSHLSAASLLYSPETCAAGNAHMHSAYSPMTTRLQPALGRMLIWTDSFGCREPSPLISSAV